MAAIHNYYRILGIKTTAGIQEINQAIAALRQKDAAGNYSATINTIAATLSEPQKRAAYDDELGLDAALHPRPEGDYEGPPSCVPPPWPAPGARGRLTTRRDG